MTVYAIHRDPFSIAPNVCRVKPGATIADMATLVATLPEGWPRHEHDCVTLNGHIVPPAVWGMVKPKAGAEIGFHAPPMGGDGGGKQILSLVASIALVAVSGGITSGALLGGLTGASAAGGATFLSRLVGAGVLLAGSAAITALSPTPSIPTGSDDSSRDVGTASATGNTLEPNTALPRVIGTRKIFPAYLSEPVTYYDGQDEVVEAVVGMAGPHDLSDIRIAGSAIDDMTGVEYETREGWPGFDPLRLVQRYGRTNIIRSELRGHTTRDDAQYQLETSTGKIEDALPQPKILTTRSAPDEFWIDVNFPQGLFDNASTSAVLRVPFRLRMRKKGDSTWTDLPEMHFAGNQIGEMRASIRLIWRDGEVSTSAASVGHGWVEGRIASPGQAVAPATPAWAADSYFDNGSGDDYVISSNGGTTAVKNIVMAGTEATIYLDTGTFPKDIYEVEVKRGFAFRNSVYSPFTYTLSGVVYDFWLYIGGGTERIAQSKEGLSEKVFIVRGISIRNEQPVQKGGVALIAVKARNVSVDQLSVLASGYVRDWDGTGWTDWTTTSNPAPHMRDVLGGLLNAKPVPAELIDDAGLVEWRTACTSAGYTVDAIIEDLSVLDAAALIAGSGYAKPYMSEIWGVMRDYDRSAETPVQVFTPHNSSGFKWSKGFADRPDGFRITFADADEDYTTRQIIHPPGAGLTEQVSYDGLVSEDDCRARADYDLANLEHRSTFYEFDAPAEAIKCRRGDLIMVHHDMLTEFGASGRVVDLTYDGSGDVDTITLDNEPPAIGGLAWADIGANDWDDIDDVSLIETSAGVVIRAGTISIHPCTISGSTLTLTTPASLPNLGMDDLLTVGPLGREASRMIVFGMSVREDLVWTITAVDEAPEVFA
nr:hypothetical protein [uncultured Roseovarius sp.]